MSGVTCCDFDDFMKAMAEETRLRLLALLRELEMSVSELTGVIAFNPETCTVTFRRQPGFLTLYPEKVYFTQVKDVDEGLHLLAALRDAINATWEKRGELVPATRHRQAPRLLDIYTLLPQTNCQVCGEATCMAFASKLLLQQQTLQACLPLSSEERFSGQYAALAALF